MKIHYKYIIYLISILLLFSTLSYSQSKKELELKRNKIKKEIEYSNKLLKQTSQSTKVSMNKLLVINRKIKNRNEVISTYAQEIRLLEAAMNQNIKASKELDANLEKVKKEYAELIYYAYKNRNPYQRLMFVLSAESFNQSYKRFKYIQQFTHYRKEQADLLIQTKTKIEEQTRQLAKLKDDKQKIIASKREEMKLLKQEKEEQAQELNDLKEKEQQIANRISEQEDLQRQLESSITTAISEQEIENEKTKKIEKTKPVKQQKTAQNTDNPSLTQSFTKQRGRLPWPLENGIIIVEFGEQPHSYLKRVRIRNDGIDISTTQGAEVFAVFEGTVSKVVTIPGANKTILLSHGDFYTIYSNLATVDVLSGDKVKKGQKLGIVFTDTSDNNVTILKFQIWNRSTKLNPVYWLQKR